jgi:hypothetical protein
MIRLLLVITILGLAGCTTALQNDPASQYYLIPVGSTLKLLKTVSIPPNTSHVNLQYGKLVSDNDLDRYYPHCQFEISTLSSEARRVEPDAFKITKVVNRVYIVSWPDLTNYVTKLWIHSDKSPQVLYMYCAQYNTDNFPDWVTVAEMKAAWGEYFSIKLANQPAGNH